MNFSAGLVPAAIFIFGAFVSFSTGSSWGIFAIMMPLAIPMAHAFGIPYAIAVGAVLSGGLFGDHCSPISDTTILSSTGAECNLIDHVKAQLPYACVNGVIAFAAFIFAGFTRSPLAAALAVVIFLAVMLVWEKTCEQQREKLLFTRCRALAARHPANSVMGRASSPSPSGDFSMGWMRYSSRPVGP